MKTTLIAAAVAALAVTAGAQTWSVRPNYIGGYNIYGGLGMPSGSIMPDYMGGYNLRMNNGLYQTIRPDYMGGWRIQQSRDYMRRPIYW
jgi:hypothetical protein